jgi:hypothetical protein
MNPENLLITVSVEDTSTGTKATRAYSALTAKHFSAGEHSYHLAVLKMVVKQLADFIEAEEDK